MGNKSVATWCPYIGFVFLHPYAGLRGSLVLSGFLNISPFMYYTVIDTSPRFNRSILERYIRVYGDKGAINLFYQYNRIYMRNS